MTICWFPMTPQTPYSPDLGDQDPLAALRESAERIVVLTSGWAAADFQRSYELGKWTARQILVHLAHAEMVFGLRVRMALTTPNYVVQPFDQNRWMAHEPLLPGPDALAVFLSLAAINRALFESLSPQERAVAITHPEQGPITVDWIIHQTAGHLIHHLKQLERIGA